MAAKLTRLTQKIAIQLRLVAQSCTICSSRCRRPVWKLLWLHLRTHLIRRVCQLECFNEMTRFCNTASERGAVPERGQRNYPDTNSRELERNTKYKAFRRWVILNWHKMYSMICETWRISWSCIVAGNNWEIYYHSQKVTSVPTWCMFRV
jgi:hypothetical protein